MAAPCRTGCKPETTAAEIMAATPEDEAAQRELADLARALHNGAGDAYAKLAAFSAKNAANVRGARAALALGYADYTRNRHKEALAWFAKAHGDKQLGDYVLYWSAQAHRAAKHGAEALEELRAIQRDYSNTAMREQFLELYAATATDLGEPQEAMAVLDAYGGIAARPELLLERGRARHAAKQLGRAAADYQAVYCRFPLSDEAKVAQGELGKIQKQMRGEYPQPGAELMEKRAQAFFDARKWREARAEFEKLAAQMSRTGPEAIRQRAQLRAAQAKIQLGQSVSVLTALSFGDAETDAERMFSIAQFYRSKKHENETELLRATNALLEKYPQSRWAEEALMGAGNYFWVQLDRARAAEYYARLVEDFPGGRNAQTAEWRVTWVTYLRRSPESDDRLRAFIEKYPTSAYTVNALYWLGRNAERGGNPAHARAFYNKSVTRYPQTYFGMAAAQRLTQLGAGEEDPPAFLAKIPPAPPLRPIDEPLPAAATERWARAQALRTIAFDSSAEQELKFAFYATAAPKLMVEAAQAAFDQGHFAAGMGYARLAVTNFEARKKEDLPLAAWKALYPLPYESALRREAAKNGLDAGLVAGLIRQESTFQADAVSRANAVGLMQVLPKTGRLLARQARVGYSYKKLFEPEYNLTLGTIYLKNLIQLTGGKEQALAAYNAGEDRIAEWSAERKYEEVPELVESIPFTETREYIQIVLRNAEAYRMIYGEAQTSAEVHPPARQQ